MSEDLLKQKDGVWIFELCIVVRRVSRGKREGGWLEEKGGVIK